jgi:hypothetical protein
MYISCKVTLDICAHGGCGCKYLLKKHFNTPYLENKLLVLWKKPAAAVVLVVVVMASFIHYKHECQIAVT